jgi:heme-degrading monooxygenase HmoA
MFARVTTFQWTAPDHQGDRAAFERILANLRQQPGFKGIYTLHSPDSGKQMGFSLWETEEQARNVDAATARERDRGIQQRGAADTMSIEVYEVQNQG